MTFKSNVGSGTRDRGSGKGAEFAKLSARPHSRGIFTKEITFENVRLFNNDVEIRRELEVVYLDRVDVVCTPRPKTHTMQ